MAKGMAKVASVVLRRLAQAVPVLALIALGSFLLLTLAPGDAVDAFLGGSGGGDAGFAARLRHDWDLDRSEAARFADYLTRVVQLDFGQSVAFARPVRDVILDRLANTILLMGSAIFLAFTVGSLLGLLAAARPGGWRDRLLTAAGLAFYAMPSFWVALMALLVFSVKLGWLPLGGIETIASGRHGLARALDIARHLVLPVGALALLYLGLYLRVMRASALEVAASAFVRAARARGLSERRVLLVHVLRNALLPAVTLLGVQFGQMLGGSVVIESVFAIPGLGRLAYEAVAERDLPLLLGILLMSGALVVAVNLAVDLLYARLDPRIAP